MARRRHAPSGDSGAGDASRGPVQRENDELSRRLTSAYPVERPVSPWWQTAQWLSVAFPAVLLVAVWISFRDDLAMKFIEARFAIEQVAALATAVAAAFAAFSLAAPGYSRKLALLPLAPLAVWLGSLGQGFLQTWLRADEAGWRIYPDWICFPLIAIVAAVPTLAMVMLLRRGTPLTSRLTVALGGLAAAALGNFGLRLFHYQDASLMVLIWQFGSVALLTALAGLSGGHILTGYRRAANAPGLPPSADRHRSRFRGSNISAGAADLLE